VRATDAVAYWTLAPAPLAVVAALAAAYVAGVRRLRRQGGRWPWWRSALFLGVGLPLVVLTVSCWPGARAHQIFAAYVTQVVMLAVVVPAVLVIGAPVRLGREALAGTGAGSRVAAVFDSRPLRVLTHPFVTPLVMLALPVVVVFTPLLRLTLESPTAYAASQLVLLLLGLVAVLALVDGQVPDAGVVYGVAAFVAFFELLLDAVPGGVLYFTTSLFGGGWYAQHGDPGGAAWALSDQNTAGAILWGVGEGIDVPFLIVLIVLWMRADAAEARRMDALLDAQEEQRRRFSEIVDGL
jgi:putative membrane protein